jgi:malate dehydrogenase (oxaloacetate-decarboxylating)
MTTFDRSIIKEEALKHHLRHRGEISIASRVDIKDEHVLGLIYNPGAATACKAIHEDSSQVIHYTSKGNLVAVVSDGSAVLGLGNIGPEAAMPVMEGKALLFKTFAGIDAVPICLGTQDPDQIVATVKAISPAFGGINLEDISAPRCFQVEAALKEALDIPVFHDDQHGTAVVALAAVLNALRVVGKEIDEVRVVVSGTGAAAIAVSRLLLSCGVQHLTMSDQFGLLHEGRTEGMDFAREDMARITNRSQQQGVLADALKGADVFIGLSVANLVTQDMVRSMADKAIVFPMANPDPEIPAEDAKAAGAAVVGTGRSDFPNQINNVLAFPGIFRGALDVQARRITEGMKIAASKAIAELVAPSELHADYIMPKTRDLKVAPRVAAAVARAAIAEGVARVHHEPDMIAENTRRLIYED